MTLKVTLNKPKSSAPEEYINNKISLSWNKVKGADFYEIYVETLDGSELKLENSKYGCVTTKDTSKNVVLKNNQLDCGLGCDSVYIRVEARDKYYDKGLEMTLYKEIAYAKQEVKLTKCEGSARAMVDEAYTQMNITSDMSDFDKIVQIQKWIDANWHYKTASDKYSNYCSCDSEDSYFNKQTANEYYAGNETHTILCENFGGCNDFAYAFKCFANKAGVPCYVITGTSKNTGSPHYWNWVCVDGYWYGYDCESYADEPSISRYKGDWSGSFINGDIYSSGKGNYNLSSNSMLIVNSCKPYGINGKELQDNLISAFGVYKDPSTGMYWSERRGIWYQ